MNQARVLFFGLAILYLVGVVVQFFLAGLGVFGASDYGAHRALGFILGAGSLVMLVVAVAGRLPRVTFLLTVLLVGLNVLQIALVNIDVDEIKALHPVNALVIVFVAYVLTQRSRAYLASKIAA
jgi:uncharacterized protein DUF6220